MALERSAQAANARGSERTRVLSQSKRMVVMGMVKLIDKAKVGGGFGFVDNRFFSAFI